MEHLKTLNLFGCYKVEHLPENLQQAESSEELDLSETAIKEPPPFISQLKNLKVFSFDGCKGLSMLKRNHLSSFKIFLVLFLFYPLLEDLDLSGNNFNSILASLAQLFKLKDRLSNCSLCNMGEGDIPSDISGPSSLRYLVLSGNNFTSILASLTRLSNLQYLGVSNRSELELLPVLLTRMTTDWKHNWAYFMAGNSYRLTKNISAITLLKTILK
ncbi:hypothetical protein GOBAR_DD13277 [Gossypium barbadense]|nr:hypothetical protein GOBAR_DD13277 [Gossypium barbadense]